MKAKDAKEYAAALDLVEQRRREGTITDGEATVWRERLLAETHKTPRPLWARILIGIFYVALAIFVLRVIIYFINVF